MAQTKTSFKKSWLFFHRSIFELTPGIGIQMKMRLWSDLSFISLLGQETPNNHNTYTIQDCVKPKISHFLTELTTKYAYLTFVEISIWKTRNKISHSLVNISVQCQEFWIFKMEYKYFVFQCILN